MISRVEFVITPCFVITRKSFRRSCTEMRVFIDTSLLPAAGCRQLPLCGLAAREHLALQAVPVHQVFNSMKLKCQKLLTSL